MASKKNLSRNQILGSPEFKKLAFELLDEMQIMDEKNITNRVDFFIERNIKN